MPGYAYILECSDGHRYFGSTNDLARRLAQHHAGTVQSTSCRLPVRLVYYEQFPTPEQARQRERAFKNGRTRQKTLDLLIRGFPSAKLAPFA